MAWLTLCYGWRVGIVTYIVIVTATAAPTSDLTYLRPAPYQVLLVWLIFRRLVYIFFCVKSADHQASLGLFHYFLNLDVYFHCKLQNVLVRPKNQVLPYPFSDLNNNQ